MATATITAKLGLDGRGFRAGLQSAENSAKRFTRNLGGYFAGAFSIAAISGYVKETMRWANETWDMSRALGVSFEEMQKLKYAAEQTGAGMDSIGTAMRTLSKFRLEALADPGSKAARLATALGVSREQLQSMTGNLQLFNRFAGIIKSNDFGAAELGIVNELMGRGATELIPAIKQGFVDMANEAARLGLVVDEKVGKSLDDLGDKLDQLKLKMRAETAPAIGGIADSLMTALEGWRLMGGGKGMRLMLEDVFGDIAGKTVRGAVETLKEGAGGGVKPIDEIIKALGVAPKVVVPPVKSERATLPRSDELARIGGFVGGAGRNRGIEIAEKQLKKLDSIEDYVRRVVFGVL